MKQSEPGEEPCNPCDAIVIGSGFAGAVTACRLAEAGQSTYILERGRRFDPKSDFPVYPTPADPNVPSDAPKDGRDTVQPDLTRFFWKFGHGVWDFRDLGDVLVGQAAGFGGGSLIYANAHMRPPAHVFDDRWPFKRADLEPYYDLAAYMLQVKPLPEAHRDLPKKVQLERAATVLHRIQFPDDPIGSQPGPAYLRTVATPLAVKFHANEKSDGQGVCDFGGNCCLGCPQHAKATLDLNYLRRAEGAETPAKVRTLAEVVWIERPEEDRPFTVVYRNHLAGGALVSVYGHHVFLCAGAVNTTELLLRCREAKKLKFPGTGLGSCFHLNQDALAAVFDCAEPQELDRGPTITTSLVYDREPGEREPSARWRMGFTGAAFEPEVGSVIRCASWAIAEVVAPACVTSGAYGAEDDVPVAIGDLVLAKLNGDFVPGEELSIDGKIWGRVGTQPSKIRHWFLIQDGGFPVAFEPALGVFRSPLWLGRNAFREAQRLPRDLGWPTEPTGGDHHDSGFDRPKEPTDDDADHIVEHAAASQRIGYATLPIEALVDLLSAFARRALGFNVPEIAEFGAQRTRERDREEGRGPWRLLPGQLQRAMGQFRNGILDTMALAAEDLVAQFIEDAAASASARLDPGLAAIAGKRAGGLDVARIKDLKLADRAFQLGVQLLWGSQGGLARAISEQLVEKKLLGRGRLVERGVDLLRHVLDYRLGNGRSAMLLSMGLDSTPGTLSLEFPHGSSEGPAFVSKASLRAELPDSVDTPERGVQERILRDIASAWDGELRTDPLWTFFDRRLTVHPQGGCPMGRGPKGVVGGVTDKRGEVHGCPGLFVMDAAAFPGPVGANPSATIAAVAEYKVAKFLERKIGSKHVDTTQGELDDAKNWVDEMPREKLDPLGPSGCVAPGPSSAEPAHRPVGIQFKEKMVGSELGAGDRLIETELTARIDDLARFLGAHARGSAEPVPLVNGFLKVAESEIDIDPTESYMLVMARPASPASAGVVREITYHLVTQDRTFEFDGTKVIHDGPGLDAWEDTTRLEFELREGEKTSHGELRLPASEFLGRQLDSFHVNTDDPTRQAWALASFGKFFFGNLASVYVPELDQLRALGARLIGRGHG